MKRVILAVLGGTICGTIATSWLTRLDTLCITKVDGDIATGENFNGFEYSFQCEECDVGDFVSVEMFTMGTGSVKDDLVMKHVYVGYER